MRVPALGHEGREPEDHSDEPEGVWRVFTDGTSVNTRLIAPNGLEVTRNVTAINFSIEANGVGHLHLEVGPAAMTLVGTTFSVAFECPNCSKTTDHKCEGTPF